MFKIIKKGSNNFWHVFNDGAKNVSISDFEVVLDDVLNTFVIVLRNGANIPQIALSVLDIIVIDETASSVEETFLTASQLRARLVVLGYTAYLNGSGVTELSQLTDVDVSGLTNGQVLVWNSTTNLWVATTIGGITTPTLQEVTTEGNEIINDAGNFKIVLDKELNGMILYALVSGTWENRGYYNNQGFNVGGYDGNPSITVNCFTGELTISQDSDIIQFYPNSATKNGVEFATEDFALKRDGSNANSDVDLGTFGIKARKVYIGNVNKIELNSDNLTDQRTAQFQNQDYIGIEDISNKGVANGYVPLNASILIPSEFLPSYVDDIIEGYLSGGIFYEESSHTIEITGEVSKIYVDLTTGQSSKQYRWSGSVYIQITNGFISSTADVPDSTDKRYQTDAQSTNNNATSPIQEQLDGKQPLLSYTPYKFIQVSDTPHTGTTAETILATATIPSNTFPSTEVLEALFGVNKTGTGGAYTIRLKINTSNTLSGAATIATFTAGSNTAQWTLMSRSFTLLGGNLRGYPFTTSQVNDVMNVGGALGSTAYNTANTLYMFWCVTLVSSSDSITPNLCNLTNN